jgi:hypothetical protein
MTMSRHCALMHFESQRTEGNGSPSNCCKFLFRKNPEVFSSTSLRVLGACDCEE